MKTEVVTVFQDTVHQFSLPAAEYVIKRTSYLEKICGVDIQAVFQRSYPETTGYIIPTFIKLSDTFCDTVLLDRAVQMGEWEIAIQMENGAVMGGKVNPNPSPAVFNTGMVLLGWIELFLKCYRYIYHCHICRPNLSGSR